MRAREHDGRLLVAAVMMGALVTLAAVTPAHAKLDAKAYKATLQKLDRLEVAIVWMPVDGGGP